MNFRVFASVEAPKGAEDGKEARSEEGNRRIYKYVR